MLVSHFSQSGELQVQWETLPQSKVDSDRGDTHSLSTSVCAGAHTHTQVHTNSHTQTLHIHAHTQNKQTKTSEKNKEQHAVLLSIKLIQRVNRQWRHVDSREPQKTLNRGDNWTSLWGVTGPPVVKDASSLHKRKDRIITCFSPEGRTQAILASLSYDSWWTLVIFCISTTGRKILWEYRCKSRHFTLWKVCHGTRDMALWIYMLPKPGRTTRVWGRQPHWRSYTQEADVLLHSERLLIIPETLLKGCSIISEPQPTIPNGEPHPRSL